MCIIIYMKRCKFFLIVDILWKDIKSKNITFTHDFFLFNEFIFVSFLALYFFVPFHYSSIPILIILFFFPIVTFSSYIHISALIVPFFLSPRSIHPFCFPFLRPSFSLPLFSYLVPNHSTNFILILLFFSHTYFYRNRVPFFSSPFSLFRPLYLFLRSAFFHFLPFLSRNFSQLFYLSPFTDFF